MNEFVDFVRNCKIGLLCRGLSRQDCEQLLGPPPSWLGRPPGIGPKIMIPGESDVWFYYNETVGVSFNAKGRSENIHMFPTKMTSCPELFSRWPIPPSANMRAFRSALVKFDIPFEEGDPGDVNYWILTQENVVPFSAPSKNGRRLLSAERPILIIKSFFSRETAKKALGL